MKSMRTRIIGVVLALVMVLSVLPMQAFAIKAPTVDYSKDADKPTPTEGRLVILDENFEDDIVGKAPAYGANGFGKTSASNATARFYVEQEENGNKYAKAYHGAPDNPEETVRSPRLDREIPLDGLTELVLDYDVKSSCGETVMSVSVVEEETNTTISPMSTPHEFEVWTHIKIVFTSEDSRNWNAEVYADGKALDSRSFDTGEQTAIRIRFTGRTPPDGSWAAIDNVVISTSNTDLGGIVGMDGVTVNWNKLSETDAPLTGFLEVMNQQHPRIYVTDWEVIKQKIATDENCKAWYDQIIRHADAQVGTPTVEYYRNARNTVNDATTNFKRNIIPVAAAYCLTGEQKYLDKVYQDLVNAGTWPDWGHDAYLCTAHMMFAYGVCYDWLYNDFTPQQREKVIEAWMKNGFTAAVQAYEGYGVGTGWINASNNWGMVCHGSNMVAAIAIANDKPELANYILAQGAMRIPKTFDEISADGGYAETLGYWDYGVRHLVKIMAALDSSVLPGKSIPSVLQFKDITGLNNSGDFPIYYNGTTGAINFGDGILDITHSPIMYYLSTKYNKPEYTWYNLDITNHPKAPSISAQGAVLALMWFDPSMNKAPEEGFKLDKFYSSTEKYGTNGISMRSSFEDPDALFIAAHAGDETMSHSNLDAGGFVLDWMGKRWVYMYGRNTRGITDCYGWPNYNTKTEEGRYQYYITRGEANNTFIINPKPGKPDMYYQYFSEVSKYEAGVNTSYGVINMTPTNEDYKSAQRGIMLTGNRDVVVVQDEIQAKAPSEIYWFVNTDAEITIAEDGKSALWEMEGDRMLVRITSGPADAKFGIMPTAPLPTSPDPDIQPDLEGHKMFIHMTNVTETTLTVEYVPLGEGEGIPAPLLVKPIADWTVDTGAGKTTSQSLSGVVALKVDNPNAYAKGAKTYVDTANLDIKPIVQNGRTLVPVRFISEKFGASVGWDDATQTVTVKTKTLDISLQIGSAQMLVNGEAVTLDVPAQTIGGRTLIPLRALVEALGKQVFWDDRGLILIGSDVMNYPAETIDKVIDLLDIRVQLNGAEMKFFDSEIYNYDVQVAKGAAAPVVSVISDKEAVVTQGNPATVTVGDKTYTIHFVENAFEGILGTGSEGVLKKMEFKVIYDGDVADYQTYLDIASAKSSIVWSDKYVMGGTYDGIISDTTQNRWSAEGAGNWIMYDLGAEKNLHSICIAGYRALVRSYEFKIETSKDGQNWETAHEVVKTTYGVDHDVYKLGDKSARYIRITGLSATNTAWMGINEVRIYDSAQMEADDQNAWYRTFYGAQINAMAGTTQRIDVLGFTKSGAAFPLEITDVKLTSTNTEIATVDANGLVTLHKAGKAEIVAEYEVLGVTIKARMMVTVE